MVDWLASNWADALSVTGLLLTAFGAGMAAFAVRISDGEAGQVAVSRFVSDDQSSWSELPMAQSLLKASRGAMRGLAFVAIGTALQVVPIVARLVG